MCDRVAIVQQGRTVTQGTVDEVLAMGRATGLLVESRTVTARSRCSARPAWRRRPTATADQLRVELPHDAGERVSRVLAEGGLYPRELIADEVDLETVFLELTRRGPQIP